MSSTRVAHWFWQRGYEVCRFTVAQLQEGLLDTDLTENLDDIVLFGGVGTVRKAVERAKRPPPPNLDLPLSVRPWAKRKVWETTLGEIRRIVDTEPGNLPVHIKPRDHQKLFTGTVISAFRDLIPSAHVDRDVPVLAQEVVSLESEWRASVLRREVVHVGHYKGDPLRFPDPSVVREACAAFVDQPIACSMDWGVTTDGETVLIEVNDGFSLGNYGVAGGIYSAMIEARWRQLMGLPDNGVGIASHQDQTSDR